jgi:hypothetical protein
VAALIKNHIGADPELIEGDRGEFTVWVDDVLVAQKDLNGFPADDEMVEAVQASLTKTS